VEEAVALIENDQAVDAVKLIAGKTSDLLYEVEHNADAVDVLTSWQETYDDVLVRVERAAQNGSSGIPTGVDSLDFVTGGLQPGWLVTVAARLGIGKTWSLIRFAYGAVTAGFNVLYFSLEQHRHQIAMRLQGLAASDLGYQLNPSQLSQGIGLDAGVYRTILEEMEQTISGKFYVNDAARGRVNVKTVAAAIEAKQPDIVLIDYLTLLQTYGADKWQGVAQLSGDLKVMAEEYGVPIVVASQLNRMGTGRDPGAEHISQSDSIGQDSDLIITLTDYTQHLRKMKVVKNRHGQSGTSWFMHFDPAAGVFEEINGNLAEKIEVQDRDED
jgi:replicative DNA helicase